MNKNDLAEAIEEGVMNGVWKPLGIAFYGLILGIGVILAVAYVFGGLWSLHDCGEWSCISGVAPAEPSCFPLENLECRVWDLTKANETIQLCNVGDFHGCFNITNKFYDYVALTQICGYQEANAWFAQIQRQYGGNLSLECL